MNASNKRTFANFASLLVASFFCISTAHSQDPQDSTNHHELIRQIESLSQERGSRVALKRLNAVLSRNPDIREELLFLKGLIEMGDGQSRSAIQTFNKLIEMNPGALAAHNNLAKIHVENGQYELAKEALIKGIESHPEFSLLYSNLVDVQAMIAAVSIKRALNVPVKPETFARLSTVYAVNGIEFFSPSTVVATKPQQEIDKPEPQAVAQLQEVVPVQEVVPLIAFVTSSVDSNQHEDISRFVNLWAQNWSNGDVDSYLSQYGAEFKPPSGLSRSQWERQRRDRIKPSFNIQVSLENLKIQQNGELAAVEFRQIYRSTTFRGSTNKRLDLALLNGQWQIKREVTGAR